VCQIRLGQKTNVLFCILQPARDAAILEDEIGNQVRGTAVAFQSRYQFLHARFVLKTFQGKTLKYEVFMSIAKSNSKQPMKRACSERERESLRLQVLLAHGKHITQLPITHEGNPAIS